MIHRAPWRRMARIVLVMLSLSLLMVFASTATSVVNYTVSNGKLQNNTVNDVFVYSTSGETSNNNIGFDANWRHGIAKTTGDPTTNPASNITLSGTQTNKQHKIRIRIESGGGTGTATFKTSIDGGTTWSTTTYTTQSTAQNLMYDATDTGLDVTFAAGASWTAGDIFTVESWWAEGAGTYRSNVQDFPQRVAIIATAGGLEIIDLSNNSVWMRFVMNNGGGNATQQNVIADSIDSVWALNGKVYLGSTATYQAGLTVIDFVQDKVWFLDNGTGWDYKGNIAMRNDGATVGGWQAGLHPSLNASGVNDVAAAVIGTHTLVLLGTTAGVRAYRDHSQIFDNTHTKCGRQVNVPAVAIVANASYWAVPQPAENGYFCGQYNPSNITGNGYWSPLVPYQTYNAGAYACVISVNVNDIAVRPNASPLNNALNIVYIATDAGLTIMHESDIYGSNVQCRHYGYTGSSNANLTYKVLAGSTDTVTAVDFINNYTAVYVGTNDGAGHGALSVLRPYMQAGDSPFLFASYTTSSTPAILSNNISAVDTSGTDVLLGTDAGANRLLNAPTAVTLGNLSAGRDVPLLAWVLAVVVPGLVLGVVWEVRRRPRG